MCEHKKKKSNVEFFSYLIRSRFFLVSRSLSFALLHSHSLMHNSFCLNAIQQKQTLNVVNSNFQCLYDGCVTTWTNLCVCFALSHSHISNNVWHGREKTLINLGFFFCFTCSSLFSNFYHRKNAFLSIASTKNMESYILLCGKRKEENESRKRNEEKNTHNNNNNQNGEQEENIHTWENNGKKTATIITTTNTTYAYVREDREL